MPGNISIENIFITCLCVDVHFIEMKSKHSPYFMHVFEKKYMNWNSDDVHEVNRNWYNVDFELGVI